MTDSSTSGHVPEQSSVRTISVADAEHYSWGNQCDGWHLVRTDSLSVISERMPPGASEMAHRHHVAQQFFFVLSGELVLDFEGKRVVVGVRQGVHVPARVVHQALNVSNAPVEFLVISQPRSHGDRENV